MLLPVHSPAFVRQHLYWPLLLFIACALALRFSALDLYLADSLYRWQGGAWRWREAWLTATVIHEGGRTVIGLAVLLLLALLLLAQFIPRWRPWRSGLWYLACASLGAGLLINVLKQLTRVDCPWDLVRYGGAKPYVPLFAPLPAGLEPGACFPAGHASAAYAWCALYYWCLRYAPRWRFWALGGVLLLGVVFGLGQQVRGAHFLSHDVWTLGLCWLFATLLYLWWFRREQEASPG
ncbi:MAG: phosphatase PAP2 family protein [Pseudomonadales bacterium]|jgi:membrane-associated PAP2 superfamily phosphatase|nr:phosphatase PAP2 family protein [Pseudomonadales bacterium]